MAVATRTQVVRIPLIGAHTTRTMGRTTSFGESGIVGLGVVGVMVVGSLTAGAQDQRFINAIPDKITNAFTNSTKFYVYKRPGLEEHTVPDAGEPATALRVWTGQGTGDKVISAFGTANSIIYDGVASLGTITGLARDITETTIGTTPNLVIPSEDSSAWYYPEGGALTEITDVDYPGNAGYTTTGTFVHLDGYAFIMTTDGGVWNSDLNSIANWTSTSFIATNMYPDKGVGLARYKDLILAFGKETIEFFRDVGNENGSPLQKVNEAFIKLGAIGPESICQFEDNVAFVASTDIFSTSVYIIDGFKPVRISDNVIDSQLLLRGSATVHMTSAKIFGKTLLFVQFGTLTFVYCVEDKMWHEWSGQGIKWYRFAANTAGSSVIYSISRNDLSGKVYKMNPVLTVFEDDGESYTMSITTSKVDFDTERRKFLHRLTIVGDSETDTSELNVAWSDDDYATFSTSRTIDLTSNRKYLNNCGQFRRRAFKLTHSDPVAVRLEAMELEVTQGQA